MYNNYMYLSQNLCLKLDFISTICIRRLFVQPFITKLIPCPENVVCLPGLLHIFKCRPESFNHERKHYMPLSDCSKGNSLIWVHMVWLCAKISPCHKLNMQQRTFSDAFFFRSRRSVRSLQPIQGECETKVHDFRNCELKGSAHLSLPCTIVCENLD